MFFNIVLESMFFKMEIDQKKQIFECFVLIDMIFYKFVYVFVRDEIDVVSLMLMYLEVL